MTDASPPLATSSAPLTVLVVDDEELMRDVTSIMLEECGYRVLTAVDGVEGLEVLKQNLKIVDLVLLDYSMPKWNGYECFIKFRVESPKLGIVMISGLRTTPEVEELRKSGEIEFLSKPFHEADLLSALERAGSWSARTKA